MEQKKRGRPRKLRNDIKEAIEDIDAKNPDPFVSRGSTKRREVNATEWDTTPLPKPAKPASEMVHVACIFRNIGLGGMEKKFAGDRWTMEKADAEAFVAVDEARGDKPRIMILGPVDG